MGDDGGGTGSWSRHGAFLGAGARRRLGQREGVGSLPQHKEGASSTMASKKPTVDHRV